MNSLDDLFHLYGDDHDLPLDEWIDFDHLAIEMESKMELSIVHRHEEEHVSQQLDSMMITTSTSNNNTIPSYLQQNYRLFDETMASLLKPQATTSLTIENLREIAVLIHHIRLTKLLISEWQVYLLSGTGEIKVSLTKTSNVSIWPEEIKKTMLQENISEIDNDSCLAYTKNYLKQLQDSLKRFEIEKNQYQNHLIGYTSQMNQKIEQYIFEYFIQQADLCLQYKLINIEYQHRNRLLEFEFEELQPSADQLQFYRKFYEVHCEYERNKIYIDLFKQYVFYKKFPPSLNQHYRLTIPNELHSIQDLSIRSTLSNRYEQIIQRTKSDLMIIHLSMAETKLRQSQEILHQYQQQLQEQVLTFDMMTLLKRRCQDYEEQLQRLYQLKMNFFVIAPTVVTLTL